MIHSFPKKLRITIFMYFKVESFNCTLTIVIMHQNFKCVIIYTFHETCRSAIKFGHTIRTGFLFLRQKKLIFKNIMYSELPWGKKTYVSKTGVLIFEMHAFLQSKSTCSHFRNTTLFKKESTCTHFWDNMFLKSDI